MSGAVAATRGLEFRLLGPVELLRDGNVLDLGGSKPYGLLALLVLARQEAVSTGALIDRLWADDPPRTAEKMIQVYVSRIRRQLGTAAECLHTTAAGYALRVEPELVDLFLFEDLLRRASALSHTDPAAASPVLREALGLWLGPALANVRAEPFATAAAARLDELRMTALEARIDADLAAGAHRQLVAELQELVATHPTREQLGAQLMVALYRSGRQADALAAAQRLRANFREELGIAPGPAVAELEVAIRRQDPALTLAAAQRDEKQPEASAAQPAAGRTWRRPAMTVAGATLVAAAVLGGAAASGRQGRPNTALGRVSIAGSSLVVIDGRSASPVADVQLGGKPLQIAVAGDNAWVTNDSLRTVTDVDLLARNVRATYGIPAQPSAVAATRGDVWIGDAFTGTITRLFTSTRTISAPFFPAVAQRGLVPLATDDRHLYAGLPDRHLIALDTANLRTSASTLLTDRVASLAYSGSTLCAALFRAPAVDCVHTPELNVTATMLLPTPALAVACTASRAWALAGAPARLFRLDIGGHSATRLGLPAGATSIAASSDYLWVLYGTSGKLMRLPIDSDTAAVTLDLGHPAASIAIWRDDVLVSLT